VPYNDVGLAFENVVFLVLLNVGVVCARLFYYPSSEEKGEKSVLKG
jgi:hypothetical protein